MIWLFVVGCFLLPLVLTGLLYWTSSKEHRDSAAISPKLSIASFQPKQGDLVRLKSGGGPVMSLGKVYSGGDCVCAWWDPMLGFREKLLHPTQLEVVVKREKNQALTVVSEDQPIERPVDACGRMVKYGGGK